MKAYKLETPEIEVSNITPLAGNATVNLNGSLNLTGDNAQFYLNGEPLDASEIPNKLDKTGGKITGSLKIESDESNGLIILKNDGSVSVSKSLNVSETLKAEDSTVTVTGNLILHEPGSSEYINIVEELNKKLTINDISNKLNTTGGTITGELKLSNTILNASNSTIDAYEINSNTIKINDINVGENIISLNKDVKDNKTSIAGLRSTANTLQSYIENNTVLINQNINDIAKNASDIADIKTKWFTTDGGKINGNLSVSGQLNVSEGISGKLASQYVSIGSSASPGVFYLNGENITNIKSIVDANTNSINDINNEIIETNRNVNNNTSAINDLLTNKADKTELTNKLNKTGGSITGELQIKSDKESETIVLSNGVINVPKALNIAGNNVLTLINDKADISELDNKLDNTGNVKINGSLTVTDNLKSNSLNVQTLSIKGEDITTINATVTANTSDIALMYEKLEEIDNKLNLKLDKSEDGSITNNLALSKALSVGGSAAFAGSATFNNVTTFTKDITVSSEKIDAPSTVITSGALNTTNAAVTQSLTVHNDVSPATLEVDNLTVNGVTQLNGDTETKKLNSTDITAKTLKITSQTGKIPLTVNDKDILKEISNVNDFAAATKRDLDIHTNSTSGDNRLHLTNDDKNKIAVFGEVSKKCITTDGGTITGDLTITGSNLNLNGTYLNTNTDVHLNNAANLIAKDSAIFTHDLKATGTLIVKDKDVYDHIMNKKIHNDGKPANFVWRSGDTMVGDLIMSTTCGRDKWADIKVVGKSVGEHLLNDNIHVLTFDAPSNDYIINNSRFEEGHMVIDVTVRDDLWVSKWGDEMRDHLTWDQEWNIPEAERTNRSIADIRFYENKEGKSQTHFPLNITSGITDEDPTWSLDMYSEKIGIQYQISETQFIDYYYRDYTILQPGKLFIGDVNTYNYETANNPAHGKTYVSVSKELDNYLLQCSGSVLTGVIEPFVRDSNNPSSRIVLVSNWLRDGTATDTRKTDTIHLIVSASEMQDTDDGIVKISSKKDKTGPHAVGEITINGIPVYSHITDSGVHVTTTEKQTWTNHVSNGNIHVTQEQKQTWTNHVENDNIHVTADEKQTWANHVSNDNIHVTTEEKEAIASTSKHINDKSIHIESSQKDALNEKDNEISYTNEAQDVNQFNNNIPAAVIDRAFIGNNSVINSLTLKPAVGSALPETEKELAIYACSSDTLPSRIANTSGTKLFSPETCRFIATSYDSNIISADDREYSWHFNNVALKSDDKFIFFTLVDKGTELKVDDFKYTNNFKLLTVNRMSNEKSVVYGPLFGPNNYAPWYKIETSEYLIKDIKNIHRTTREWSGEAFRKPLYTNEYPESRYRVLSLETQGTNEAGEKVLEDAALWSGYPFCGLDHSQIKKGVPIKNISIYLNNPDPLQSDKELYMVVYHGTTSGPTVCLGKSINKIIYKYSKKSEVNAPVKYTWHFAQPFEPFKGRSEQFLFIAFTNKDTTTDIIDQPVQTSDLLSNISLKGYLKRPSWDGYSFISGGNRPFVLGAEFDYLLPEEGQLSSTPLNGTKIGQNGYILSDIAPDLNFKDLECALPQNSNITQLKLENVVHKIDEFFTSGCNTDLLNLNATYNFNIIVHKNGNKIKEITANASSTNGIYAINYITSENDTFILKFTVKPALKKSSKPYIFISSEGSFVNEEPEIIPYTRDITLGNNKIYSVTNNTGLVITPAQITNKLIKTTVVFTPTVDMPINSLFDTNDIIDKVVCYENTLLQDKVSIIEITQANMAGTNYITAVVTPNIK